MKLLITTAKTLVILSFSFYAVSCTHEKPLSQTDVAFQETPEQPAVEKVEAQKREPAKTKKTKKKTKKNTQTR